ncbi:ECF transporter S component [Traorella massiliensis]|uniref:ECF transporter S component n=1 Tax=Traorella massiliensis TaxID=1903263 RepID=UPI0008F8E82A|nr:ECF transporter S component [Traorella massiliensis]
MKNSVKNITLTAMFLALGMILPFFTGQIPQIGNMLLPMHLPVFLCALICGWQYGTIMAFILPLLRSLVFGMPPFYPTALAMAFELATYAFVTGHLYEKSPWQCIKALYRCMICAMLAGRVVWGIVQMILLSVNGGMLTFEVFISSALLNSIPGIIMQLVLIPAVMVALDRTKVLPFKHASMQTKNELQ